MFADKRINNKNIIKNTVRSPQIQNGLSIIRHYYNKLVLREQICYVEYSIQKLILCTVTSSSKHYRVWIEYLSLL